MYTRSTARLASKHNSVGCHHNWSGKCTPSLSSEQRRRWSFFTTESSTKSSTTANPPPSSASNDGGMNKNGTGVPTKPALQKPTTKQKKTMAQMDEELRLAMEGRAGDGGESGLELEDGKPVSMKRGVRDNMFRYI